MPPINNMDNQTPTPEMPAPAPAEDAVAPEAVQAAQNTIGNIPAAPVVEGAGNLDVPQQPSVSAPEQTPPAPSPEQSTPEMPLQPPSETSPSPVEQIPAAPVPESPQPAVGLSPEMIVPPADVPSGSSENVPNRTPVEVPMPADPNKVPGYPGSQPQ